MYYVPTTYVEYVTDSWTDDVAAKEISHQNIRTTYVTDSWIGRGFDKNM